ncbi:transposase [Flavobacterium sp. PL12]|uniref:transposase n=1 Tax=Flavobacterium sp. PL12 TaxID=3071718 RepID=UPI00319DECF5
MAKFQNKYRIESARATWWNYGWAGAYFITICTQNRNHYFGNIDTVQTQHAPSLRESDSYLNSKLYSDSKSPNPQTSNYNKINLSNCGVLADVFWHEIKNHAKNVALGAFVVMPNHIHGILILTGDSELDFQSSVQTGHAPSFQDSDLESDSKSDINSNKNTVSSIIGSYKSAVTKHANRLGFEFGWQTRFHDHIIRNDAEYQRINDYIESNIQNWKTDKFFK